MLAPPLKDKDHLIDWSRLGDGMETRTFLSEDNRSYLVYRYKRPNNSDYSYHVFLEVETKASSRHFLGKPPKSKGKKFEWWGLWPQSKSK